MKQKSHSGMKKRIKKTGTGKLMAAKANKRHLLANKSKRQKKANLGGKQISAANLKFVKKLLPNL